MLSLSVRFAQAENEEIYKQHKCLLVGDWISAIVLMWYHRYTSCIFCTFYMRFIDLESEFALDALIVEN